MHRFANPGRFLRLSAALLPWVTAGAIVCLATGLIWGFVFAPPDYQQGESVRIIYIHVPAAWMAMFVYTCIARGQRQRADLAPSFGRSDRAGRLAPGGGLRLHRAGLGLPLGQAHVGHLLGLGRPPHLHADPVLPLSRPYGPAERLRRCQRGNKAAAILALVGFVNVPIIKFSVDWWNTLHQPESVFRMGGPTIDPSILIPMMITALGFTLFFLSLLILRVRSEFIAARLRVMAAAAGR